MTDAQLIDKWLEAHGGPRCFEGGASSEVLHMRSFLEARGFVLRSAGPSTPTTRAYQVTSPNGGRPRRVRAADLVAFVDEVRVAEGLTPIRIGGGR